MKFPERVAVIEFGLYECVNGRAEVSFGLSLAKSTVCLYSSYPTENSKTKERFYHEGHHNKKPIWKNMMKR